MPNNLNQLLESANAQVGLSTPSWAKRLSKSINSKNITIADWNLLVQHAGTTADAADAIQSLVSAIIEYIGADDVPDAATIVGAINKLSEHDTAEAERVNNALADLKRYVDSSDASLICVFDTFNKAFDKISELQDALIGMGTLYRLNITEDGYTCFGARNLPTIYIAEYVNNLPVTSIAFQAFKGYTALKELVIPSTVKFIEVGAFNDCVSLEKVVFRSTPESTLTGLFDGCTSLKEIYVPWSSDDAISLGVPNTVTIHYDYPYTEGFSYAITSDGNSYQCTAYTGTYSRAVIPDTYQGLPVKEVYPIFNSNKSLESVRFGENITQLTSNICASCTNLEDVHLSGKLTMIGDYAFKDCANLKAVTTRSGNVSKFSIGDSAFAGCTLLDNFPLYRAKSIGFAAFASCAFKGTLVIPDNVERVESYAFTGCNGVTSVQFLGTPSSINVYAFKNMSKLKDIYVPWDYAEVSNAPWGATSANIHYTYPYSEGLTYELNSDGTYSCTGYLGSESYVAIPKTYLGKHVTKIAKNAFYNNSSEYPTLTSIKIGANVTVIGYASFYNTFIKSVHIPESVTKIDAHAFRFGDVANLSFAEGSSGLVLDTSCFDATAVDYVQFPARLKTLNSNAFRDCKNLNSVVFNGTPDSIASNAFTGCSDVYFSVPWSSPRFEGEENCWGATGSMIHYGG